MYADHSSTFKCGVKMCSQAGVNDPEDGALDWRSQNRNTMNFINVACLVLSLTSTAISIGVLVIYRTNTYTPVSKSIHWNSTQPERSTNYDFVTPPQDSSNNPAHSRGTEQTFPVTSIAPQPEPEPLKPVTVFQGPPRKPSFNQRWVTIEKESKNTADAGILTSKQNILEILNKSGSICGEGNIGLKQVAKGSSKLEWKDGSHRITEKGNYFVYVQVTFKGECSGEKLFLKTTLCKKQVKIKEKELLVTSLSVCESQNHTSWTRTLSQAAIFYFEKGDNIHVNTTTMEYVDFNHSYNNIFGIYRL